VPAATVGFNYLGRVDHETSRSSLFTPLPGGFGERRPVDAFSPHRVDITSLVVNGRLVTEFLWSDPGDHGAVAARVAARYTAVLRALVADCLRLGGPGVTPSDFSMIAIDEAALAAVLHEVERGEEPHS
jgi:non-ribosomal peptide synthase protein (TIGR01720 family)